MIFAIETFDDRYAREREWHRAFAWLPVRLMSGEVAWLQFVNRRAVFLGLGGPIYDYMVAG